MNGAGNCLSGTVIKLPKINLYHQKISVKSGKWKDIMNGVKKQLKNDNARIKELLAKELGEVAVGGRQTSLADCRGK
jgi:hypothetical protein